MTWLRHIGTFEYILIATFLLLYAAYIVRIIIIARKMKSEFKTVFYKFLIRTFYFSLLIIALLGPSFGNLKKEVKSISKDIYLVVDISLSMNATDIEPSRLEKTKLELKNIIRSFSSDRVGLIAFGSSAFIQCPSTYDQSALTLFIETLHNDLLAQGGSDMSEGLKLALKQLLNSPASGQNKVIVLVTDGEHFGKNLKEVAAEIRKNNIHLMVLGVGTNAGSKIPVYGTFKKDKKGNTVITRLESEALKKLASESGGAYFEISQFNKETDFLAQAVNKIEGSVTGTREIDASANKYFYFLLVALFFIIIDVLVTVRTVKI